MITKLIQEKRAQTGNAGRSMENHPILIGTADSKRNIYSFKTLKDLLRLKTMKSLKEKTFENGKIFYFYSLFTPSSLE